MEIQRNGEGVLIKNTGEISLEELEKLREEGLRWVEVADERCTNSPKVYGYDIFKKIKQKMSEYTKNVPKVSNDDPDKEKKIFTYIYERIAKNISYDERVAGWCGLSGYDRDMAEVSIERASNLEGLLEDRVLCAGYSEILRNMLSEVGIDALYISGGPKTMGEAMTTNSSSHAWNQVNLDGKWYNCDITNDADFILEGLKLPHFLKSNDEFTRYKKFPCKDPSKIQESTESISEEKQEELIEEQRKRLLREEKIFGVIASGDKQKSVGQGFIAKLKSFFKDKKVGAKELHDFTMDGVNRDERGRE